MQQHNRYKHSLIPILAMIFLLWVCNSTLIPIHATDDLDSKVQNLLQQMTLEEKIGQMIQVDRTALADVDDIRKYGFGSMLSGGDSNPPGTTPEQMADWVDTCHRVALQTRLKIPLLYGVDAVHGNNNVVNAVIFPHNIGMGATGDPRLVEEAARITALETAGAGIRWTFAPCVAVARDERWGRAYESYGETTDLPTILGVAAIKGFQGSDLSRTDSILACAKHYVGDGGTTFGTGVYGGNDQGDTRVSEDLLRRLYLPPFEAAVKVGVGSVMVSFSSWNGQKLHSHQYLITKVLKEESGFKGIVVSDWRGFEQLPGNYGERIAAAVNAGIDMLMAPSSYQQVIGTIQALVANGRISATRIDDAAGRVLRVKFQLDLFAHPFTDRNLTATVGVPEHREVARECVRRSLVLLKNDAGFLPLSPQLKRIVVAGRCADNLGFQCGGWTVGWQGGSGNITGGMTVLEAIRRAVSPRTTISYVRDGKVAGKADAAIVVVGETPYAEFQGDITNPAKLMLDDEDRLTVLNLKKAGIPMAIVLISGRPLVINDELIKSKAFVAAWLPGTEGQGVADLLFGVCRPTGKLPFSWPKNPAQIPMNSGNPQTAPLFQYGFGLSF